MPGRGRPRGGDNGAPLSLHIRDAFLFFYLSPYTINTCPGASDGRKGYGGNPPRPLEPPSDKRLRVMGSRPSRGPLRALGGPRPRPRGERPGAPDPDNRHTKEAWTGFARLSYGEALARCAAAERFQNQPARWGRGRERGSPQPPSSSGRGGNSNPFQRLHSVIPVNPRDERLPVWVSQLSPARPRSHSAHPWTPFSRLPPRSLNVRLPLAFPLGAALRRRETRNLGRYHRARPRGWPKRSEPVLSGSSLPKPLTRSSPKEPDVTRGLIEAPRGPARR